MSFDTSFHLRTSFHDRSDADYDDLIRQGEEEINKKQQTFEKCLRLQTLIDDIVNKKAEYHPRPCVEGWCFGTMTPHRSRIDRRIESLNNHLKACNQISAKESAMQQEKRKYIHEENLKKLELEARLKGKHEVQTVETKHGIFS